MKKLRHRKFLKLRKGHIVPELELEPSFPDSKSFENLAIFYQASAPGYALC